jgi:hypothetical protein
MNVKATTTATETSGQQLRTSKFAKVGIWLAAAWLPIDWNLGQLGVVATFLFAPIGVFCGANALGRIRDGRESGRTLARWTLTLGALGTTFAFCLLVTR